jgi:hypothetical protein
MDVMQREVEMYENEIRSLKDFKSPTKRGAVGSTRTPRRGASAASDFSLNPRGVEDSQSISALEASLFRPLLQEALEDAARWRVSATAEAIKNLSPLPKLSASSEGNFWSDDLVRLSAAISANRIQKASVAMVDVTNTTKTPRAQLNGIKAKSAAASERLQAIMMQCRGG